MFDQALINKNKSRFAVNIKNSEFFQFVREDLRARLEPIGRAYKEVLWIEDGELGLGQGNEVVKTFDLICFPFGLHRINDVQQFLLKIRSLLKRDGIFICNFPGTGSLAHLRKTLFLAEESCGHPHSPHIFPFIKFDDVASLLQQAGFAENICDYEHLLLEYDSPISLMKALKYVGESNAIAGRSYYSITKSMYKFLQDYHWALRKNDSVGGYETFQDQVNLITLICSPTKHSIKLKSEYFTK